MVEEDALTFLTRALALRQQVIFACDQGRGSEIQYTPEQVQSLFLRRLEFAMRDPTIRAKLGPCLSDPGISDQNFITTLSDIIAREEEHRRLIGSVRPKVRINEVEATGCCDERSHNQTKREPKAGKLQTKVEAMENSLNQEREKIEEKSCCVEENESDVIHVSASNQEDLADPAEREDQRDFWLYPPPSATEICRLKENLIESGPYQPQMKRYPDNPDVPGRKQCRFVYGWFKDCPHLEYSIKSDQNEFVDILPEDVKDRVVNEVREARMLSAMADISPDTANTDRLVVAVRYVNTDNEPRVNEMKETRDKDGKRQAKDIVTSFYSNGLSRDELAFQSYDYILAPMLNKIKV
eukprot:gene11072-19933_t